MAIELINTGIEGLDEVLKGGLRKKSSLLITGAPGTGKTIMALQFIFNGAAKYNENGIFISTEENLDDLRNYFLGLGMNLDKYEKEGKITLVETNVARLKGGIASLGGLLGIIRKNKVKRVALDSLLFFDYLYVKRNADPIEYRRQVLLFLQQMKNAGVTFITTSERPVTDLDKFDHDTMDFLFEGFIVLTKIRKSTTFERCLTVAKMRGQDHSLNIYPISIGNGGVTIFTDQLPFSLISKDEKKE